MVIIDMISMSRVKDYIYGIVSVIVLSGVIISSYSSGVKIITDLINMGDYIHYDPKQIPILLFIPVMIYLELFSLCIFIPSREKIVAIMQKLMIPVVGVYGLAALIIGILISMIISIYPLGTDYYQCKSTSIVSSGSHYGKTKEICKQRAYSAASHAEP